MTLKATSRAVLLLLAATQALAQGLPADRFDALRADLDTAVNAAVERATAVPAAQFDAPVSAPVVQSAAASDLDEFARHYWSGQSAAARRAFSRVQSLRAVVEPILREEGVPAWVLAVAVVESGGRPDATSPKGARGLWQFMPETARRYGLVVSAARDDRTDLVLSTRAAARHLRDLHATFGDWELALAAYNYGEGGVQRSLRRAGAADFRGATPALPAETRLYVPAVAAARRLLGLDGSQPAVRRMSVAHPTPGH